MIFLDFPGEAGDPYWNDVLALLPLSDSGTSFTDYGPLANTVQLIGGDPGNTFEQNSAVTLWGKPTLEDTKAGGTQQANLYINDTTKVVPVGADYCIEWSYYQTLWASAGNPVHAWLQRTPGDPLMAAASEPTNQLVARSLGANYAYSPVSSATWHDVALQFLYSTNTTYFYFDGVQVGSFLGGVGDLNGFRFFVAYINTVAPGTSGLSHAIRYANVRATAANRYGNNSTIARPTGPWPTHA